jgi:serine/threonine protein kinase
VTLAKPAIQTFGKYQILERIATGGMAEIYKARLEGIGGFQRTFAIKRILPHLSQNAEYVAMLVDEAKVAGLLSHANIVQILDLGQVNSVWYIAMEYVEGRDLGGVLRRARDKGLSLPVPHTVFITIELLKGLEYAHQRQVMRGGRPVPLNIIHRDVSPPNILLSFQGEVKLTDFGIARASLKALETQAGVIKGRFDYMSPEQAAGAKDLDQRSDLFSVGVVLFEMLTGRHPFAAESELGTLERIRTGQYPSVSSLNQGVPFQLETIVDRALRVDRNERYPSATAFKEALDKFFHDSGFIFTHSTLAAYVKGLFPRVDGVRTPAPPPPRVAPQVPEFDVPDDVDLPEFESEGPTRMIDQSAVSGLSKPRESRFGLKAGDESTLVRNNPLQEIAPPGDWDDEQETVIKANPMTPIPQVQRLTPVIAPPALAADEQETLIKRSPFTPEQPTRELPVPDLSLVGQLATPKRGLPTPQSRPNDLAVEDAAVQPKRRGAGPWAAILLSLITFVLGLFVGTAAGAIGAQLLVSAPVKAPVILPDPMLTVMTPEGAEVKVDGSPASGTISVAPDQGHVVVVSLGGQVIASEEITLAPGEIRVLMVTVPKVGEGTETPPQ